MAENKDKKALNVPHLRFPEFSGEYKNTSLGKIGKTFNGLTGKSGSDFGQGFPYITYKSIFDNSKIDISRVEYVEITDVERKKETQNKVQYGDVFFTTSSETPDEVGMSSVLLDEVKDCYLNSFCFGYRLNSLSKTVPEYMRFYLRSKTIRKKMFVLAQGSTRFNISKSEVMGMTINIPEIEEQRKIANLLTLLDDRIATQNKVIEDLKKLKSAITDLLFHSIADAHTIRLGEIAHITNGVGDVQDANTEHQEDWYPFFDRSEELKWFPTYSFDKEAVIYAGEGQSFYPRYYNGKFALHQRCYAITDFASCIIPKYCYHFMNTLNSYFVRNSVGSTVPSLRMDIFQKVGIRLPPIPKQQHICKIIDAFYTKLEVEQRGISTLQELKQFLLSQMFI